jgi:hypothetical protein
MPGGVTLEAMRHGVPPTELERRALRVEAGAPVTGAVATGDGVAAAYGDGRLRLFRPGLAPAVIAAHQGAILGLAAGPGFVLTGGDDGRVVRTAADGGSETLADFARRWVDCVAAHPSGLVAWSSGRTVHVRMPGETRTDALEHPSTVGGLDFGGVGAASGLPRLGVAHYGGATLWERAGRKWKPTKLDWRGSHVAARFSPDGRHLVTAMQEDALHGWRLRDKADMRMTGYPAKPKSMAWVGAAPWLATSGAEEAICWPFDGRDGPMGRAPETACHGGGRVLCSAVAGLPGEDFVVAGFRDGSVLAGRVGGEGEAAVKGSGGAAVVALALTREGRLFIGAEDGLSLWARLGGGA